MNTTSRDLRLLRLLSNYGMLSSRQIEEFVFGKIATTTVLRRLRALEKVRLIKRIPGLENYELLWMLTPKGADTANVSLPKSKWSRNMLEHDFKLVALRIALEGNGVAHSWTPEHEIRTFIFKKHGFRGIKERLVPDAFMGIDIDGRKESVAIELELTLKSQKRLKKTLGKYAQNSTLHAVWYVASNKSILDSVWRQWQEAGGMRSKLKFYASTLEEIDEKGTKARLMGTKPHRLIEEAWTLKQVPKPAQGVSRQPDKTDEDKTQVTNENHAPNLEMTG
jgi:DNA-binding Lrp family transcriptional regulator